MEAVLLLKGVVENALCESHWLRLCHEVAVFFFFFFGARKKLLQETFECKIRVFDDEVFDLMCTFITGYWPFEIGARLCLESFFYPKIKLISKFDFPVVLSKMFVKVALLAFVGGFESRFCGSNGFFNAMFPFMIIL